MAKMNCRALLPLWPLWLLLLWFLLVVIAIIDYMQHIEQTEVYSLFASSVDSAACYLETYVAADRRPLFLSIHLCLVFFPSILSAWLAGPRVSVQLKVSSTRIWWGGESGWKLLSSCAPGSLAALPHTEPWTERLLKVFSFSLHF